MQIVEKFVTPTSAETIWQILADVEHWKDWTPTILEIRPLTDEGLRVGARYRVLQPGLKPAVYEVTDCTPNKAFTWVQKLPGGGLIADHKIGTRDGATEIELSFSSKGLLAHVVAVLFSKKTRLSVAAEARGLRAKCEEMMKRGNPYERDISRLYGK